MKAARGALPINPHTIEADHRLIGLNGSNPNVSTQSRFNDKEWNFEQEITSPTQNYSHKVIDWSFEIVAGRLFTDEKYASLLLASRQMLFAMLRHPKNNHVYKPLTVMSQWGYMREFITFLANRTFPILRLKDVTRNATNEFIAGLKSRVEAQEINESTLYGKLRALERLYQYRHQMYDSLQFDPFDGESPGKLANYTQAYKQQHKTASIPDEILSKLVKAALDYVDDYAELLLKAAESCENFRQEHKGRMPSSRIRYYMNKMLREEVSAFESIESVSIRIAPKGLRELRNQLQSLHTACAILIAFVTGMRVSEILSMKAGCIEVERTDEGEFIWIKSLLHKMQSNIEGTPTRWLGGPLAAKAVSILERLAEFAPEYKGEKHLFGPVMKNKVAQRGGAPISAKTFNIRLREFVKRAQIRDDKGNLFHLHSHMFRRTFARQVVRSDTTNLLALKDHFKHWSVAMTDSYVGMDEELQSLLDDEADKLSFESFDKVMKADRLGGPRGKQVVKMINTAIADGRLAPEFRGEAGAHLRKEMIVEIIEAGQQIYPCPTGNWCWFRDESALCTKGDRPIVEICNPAACTNSIIHKEHLPHWQDIKKNTEDLLRMNPKGEPYKSRLVKINRIAAKVTADITPGKY